MSGRHGLLGFPFSAQTLKSRMEKGPALDPRSVPGCRVSLIVLTSARPFLRPSPAQSAQEASFLLQVRGCSLDLYPEISRRGRGIEGSQPCPSAGHPSGIFTSCLPWLSG